MESPNNLNPPHSPPLPHSSYPAAAASSSSSSPPNPVIPPRTSSTGLYRSSLAAAVASGSGSGTTSSNHNSNNNGTSASASASPTHPPQSFTQPAPLPSVLSSVSEADWLGVSRHQNNHGGGQHLYQFQRQPTPRGPLAMAGGSGHAVMEHYYTPPQQSDPSRYAHEDLEFTPKRSWTDNKEKVVRAPFDYVSSHPGKDFRAQLINAFNALLEVPQDRLDIITRAVGMLHESSLLVDDVQDSSELRRGYPVAHNIFGVPQTINSANYIYFVALQELQTMNNPQIISMFAEELVNLHRGQGMDLFWRDTLTCPTEDDYLEMVGNKTGGLFRLGIKLMQAESTTSVDCVPLVNLMGLIFQIRDDYMNLSSSEYSDNKGLCEDLTEGKFSFPVIHSIRSNPANMQLINILKQRPTDVQVKRYAVSYMESTGSFEYTRSVIAILIERARKMAEEIDGGTGRAAGMHKILDKMVVT